MAIDILDRPLGMAKIFGSIQKVEDQDDGTIMVHGVASSECRDHAGEIILAEAMRKALPDYSKFPALREMHQPMAAGKVVEVEVDEDGITHIAAHVVDPIAIVKVRTGVYLGFSIGGKVLKRDSKDRSVITDLRLIEISLVDSPCNPDAVLSMWKADMTEFKPEATDVIARAKTLAKAAGTQRFKDFLFEAGQELISEHLIKTGQIDEPRADATAEPDIAAAADGEPEGADQAAAAPGVLAIDSAGAEPPAGEGKEAAAALGGADEPGAAPNAEPAAGEPAAGDGGEGKEAANRADPAAAIAAAIEKGHALIEGASGEAAPADHFADLGKAAAALRAIGVGEGGEALSKCLWHVSRFADLLDSFACLQRSVAYEAADEGDNSPIPAQLAEQVKASAALLIAMAQEEVAELVASSLVVIAEGGEPAVEILIAGDGIEAGTLELAGQIVDLVKTDQTALASAGERLAKAIPAGQPDLAAKAARADDLEAENGRLSGALADAGEQVEKMVGDFGKTIDGLKVEVADLRKRFEAEPIPAKTAGPAAIRPVNKSADSAGAGGEGPKPTEDEMKKYWDGLSDEEKGFLMVKASLANPSRIAPGR